MTTEHETVINQIEQIESKLYYTNYSEADYYLKDTACLETSSSY